MDQIWMVGKIEDLRMITIFLAEAIQEKKMCSRLHCDDINSWDTSTMKHYSADIK